MGATAYEAFFLWLRCMFTRKKNTEDVKDTHEITRRLVIVMLPANTVSPGHTDKARSRQ